jgi:hypothetical protein
MLAIGDVNRVAEKAAAMALRRVGISRVFSEPMIDADGQAALDVTVVLKRGTLPEVTGADAARTMVRVSQALEKSGEERPAIIQFATEEELESELSDDAES